MLRVRLGQVPMLHVPPMEDRTDLGLVVVVTDLRWTGMGWKIQVAGGAWYGLPPALHELERWAAQTHLAARRGAFQFPAAFAFRTGGGGTVVRLLSRASQEDADDRSDTQRGAEPGA